MEEETKKFIINLAKKAIEVYVKANRIISKPREYPSELNEKRGVFVTIYKKVNNQSYLRGCIGLPYPTKPLIEGIIEAAISATRDPRFPPLDEKELKEIFVEVSILSKPEKIEGKNYKEILEKIRPFKDGIIIKKGTKSALFLPQVWDDIPKKEEFLSYLCIKAGLPPNEWTKEGTEFYKFEAEVVEEKI
ncbi:MAG: AmmeMemoRadiSam system protein A [Candidatus Aenigmatarchaeota archaeon]